jgi:hypothetical protein
MRGARARRGAWTLTVRLAKALLGRIRTRNNRSDDCIPLVKHNVKGNAMKHRLAKLALSTAIIGGSLAAAQACPQTTALDDGSTPATFQLAQASGTGATGTGTSPGTGNNAATTSPSTGATNSNSGGGGNNARPLVPPEEPMRQPATPNTPGTTGTGQTNPTTPQ